jgi:hypothetical protein
MRVHKARLDERHVSKPGSKGIVVAWSMLLIALVLIGIAKLLL